MFSGVSPDYTELKLEVFIQAAEPRLQDPPEQNEESTHSTAGFRVSDIRFYVSTTSIALRSGGLYQRGASGFEVPLSTVNNVEITGSGIPD